MVPHGLYLPATVEDATVFGCRMWQDAPRRVPFGWPAIDTAIPVRLSFAAGNVTAAAPALRVTVALDLRAGPTPQRRTLGVICDGKRLGRFDLRYTPALQTVELPVSPAQAELAARHGVRIVGDGRSPGVIIFGDDPTLPASMRPHLLAGDGGDPVAALRARLATPPSLLTLFGWCCGCVTDAFLHNNAAARLRDYLAFFLRNGSLVYEDPHSRPSDDRLTSIEATLPVAALAAIDPAHPVIDLAVDFWRQARRADGLSRDHRVTAEGMLTVCYPMAAVAAARGDVKLARQSVMQVIGHARVLRSGGRVALRVGDDGARTFVDWGRAWGWYLLGMARTIDVASSLGVDVSDAVADFRTAADFITARVRPGGWGVFVDESLPPDPSASCAIATALDLAAARGWIRQPSPWPPDRLQNHLTPDGRLRGVAPENRGGEPLQRSPYRALANWADGLALQRLVVP